MSRRLNLWLNPFVRSLGVISLVFFLLLVIWLFLRVQMSSISSPTAQIQDEIATLNDLVKTIGGLLVFVTAFVSVRDLKASEEKQISERFSKAVEMLGHEESVHVRLGGIYALERIARDSKKDYYPVMQVLAAFVRIQTPVMHAQQKPDAERQKTHQYDEFSSDRDHHEQEQEENSPKVSAKDIRAHYAGDYKYFIGTQNARYVPNHLIDVQAAVSAIGRYKVGVGSSYPLNLSKALLEGITFEGSYENVSFCKTHFKDCVSGNQLVEESAIFRNGNFREAIFEKVEFEKSIFEDISFDNSVFISSISWFAHKKESLQQLARQREIDIISGA